MIRRLFWALLGLGFGVVIGMRTLRQVDRMAEAAKPGTIAERTGRRIGGTQSRLQHAIAVGRAHARERELAMRERYGVPTLDEVADLGGSRRPSSGRTDDARTAD